MRTCTADSDWWAVPYARFFVCSRIRELLGYNGCKTKAKRLFIYSVPYKRGKIQLYRLCTETIVRARCNTFLRAAPPTIA